MWRFFRRFKPRKTSESDLAPRPKKQPEKKKKSWLKRLFSSAGGLDNGLSSVVHEAEQESSRYKTLPHVLPPVDPFVWSDSTNGIPFSAGTGFLALDGLPAAKKEYMAEDTSYPDGHNTRHGQAQAGSPSAGPSIPPSGLTAKEGPSSRQPSAIDASIHISSQGVEYHIGGKAIVHFHYGSHINTHSEQNTLDVIIQGLTRSHNAEYNMVANVTRGPCTPETRTFILEKMVDWCNSKSISLYWMNGMAGTGKTTIVYSLCKMLEDVNLLGASFFCSRSLTDCRDVKLIFPTIAFQLAQRYPPFAEALTEALRKDTDVLNRVFDVQLRKLLIDPWNARKSELPKHVVVVLDALDECDKNHSAFLRVIIDHVGVLPFKTMLTSRPEPAISSVLLNKDAGTLSTFILHEVEENLVEEDIARYVKSQLEECLPSLSSSDILQLSKHSGKFFVYAATLCRFIAEEDGDHIARLRSLLSLSPSDVRDMAVRPIDALYIEILRRALSDKKPRSEIEGIREVLHIIVFARNPLTRDAIADLLGSNVDEVESRVKSLRSLIFVPQAIDKPLSTFHTSLLDFVQNPTHSERFYCRPAAINLYLAKQCLSLMNHALHMNLCQLVGRPANDSIDPDVIDNHITAGLQYATIHWTVHWKLSDHSEREVLMSLIGEFLTTRVLHWFESLSLIQVLPVGISSLEVLLDGLDEHAHLAKIARDFLRFIQYSYDLIKSNAMETYFSALTWIPINSPLRSCYAFLCNQAPQVLCGLVGDWTGPDQTIDIHSDDINSITISRDGRWIVSGSEDGTVRVWNMDSHVQECVLKHGVSPVYSVALSGDGNCIVSGSVDTVHTWNIAMRQAPFTFHTPTGILAVAMSPDGRHAASAHTDHLTDYIHVWNTTTGELVHSIKSHTERTNDSRSISFTFDNARLVFVSDDWSACIWDAKTWKAECSLYGHSGWVVSLACSSIEDRIVTGSVDKTARLWDISGRELQVLQGHLASVCCVAFTPDGNRVVTGSDDKTFRIWDATSGNTVRVFAGFSHSIRSVAVFPDRLKVASCSDKTISVWSLKGEASIGGKESKVEVSLSNLETEVTRMVFSPSGRRVLLLPYLQILNTTTLKNEADSRFRQSIYRHGAWSTSGNKVAAVATDRVIKIWNLANNDSWADSFTLQGHSEKITSISFSHDENRLISASEDRNVRLWDLASQRRIRDFNHVDPCHGASFSHDDTRVVSMTIRAIHIWNTRSGELLRQFSTEVTSAAFTPGDQHIVTSYGSTVKIWNTKSYDLEYAYEGYKHWTTHEDGSYALSDDGQWICHSPCLGDQPRRRLWIPHQYQPKLPTKPPRFYSVFYPSEPPVPFAFGPLFTSSSKGIQVCLPREGGLVTLVIPRGNYKPA